MTEGATGRVLDGRYQLTDRLGSGGMGTVYRAHDTRLDRMVAVKLLRSTDDDVHRARLHAEARFAGALKHPGIVRVFDFGEERGPTGTTPYLVMQLVDGAPVTAPLAPERVAELLAGVADALAVAHAAGVVHRDLKPSNILVAEDGRPVIVDFGVARSDSAEPLTETGFVVGTAEYLSPEQVEGFRATPASDVYALGVVAHQCLTGRPPFQRETPIGTALAHLRDELPDLPNAVPAGLRTLVRAMLSRTPQARPTAAEVAARASAAPGTRTVVLPPMPATPPPSAAPVAGPWVRHRAAIVAAASVALFLALVVTALAGRDPTAPTAAAAGTGERKAQASDPASRTPPPTPTSTPTTPTSTPAAPTKPDPRPKAAPGPQGPPPHARGPGRKKHGPPHAAGKGKHQDKGPKKGPKKGHR